MDDRPEGSPAEIADRAMTLALSFLDHARKEIVDLSGGDMEALYMASQIVRERADGSPSEHAGEHLAFSLITAAHTQLRERSNPTRG